MKVDSKINKVGASLDANCLKWDEPAGSLTWLCRS